MKCAFLSASLSLLVLSGCGGADTQIIHVGAVPPYASGSNPLANAKRDSHVPFIPYNPQPNFLETERRVLEDAGVYVVDAVCMVQSFQADAYSLPVDGDTPWVVFSVAAPDLPLARSLGLDEVKPDQLWQQVSCDWP